MIMIRLPVLKIKELPSYENEKSAKIRLDDNCYLNDYFNGVFYDGAVVLLKSRKPKINKKARNQNDAPIRRRLIISDLRLRSSRRRCERKKS